MAIEAPATTPTTPTTQPRASSVADFAAKMAEKKQRTSASLSAHMTAIRQQRDEISRQLQVATQGSNPKLEIPDLLRSQEKVKSESTIRNPEDLITREYESIKAQCSFNVET